MSIFLKRNNGELSMVEKLRGSLMGFITADALGVPVEFIGRDTLKLTRIGSEYLWN